MIYCLPASSLLNSPKKLSTLGKVSAVFLSRLDAQKRTLCKYISGVEMMNLMEADLIEKLQFVHKEAEEEEILKMTLKKNNQIHKPFNLEFSLKIIQKE